MKLLYLASLFLYLMLSGCNTENAKPDYKIGEGVEIYLAKNTNPFDYKIDYAEINLDTIQLQEVPIIRYNHIEKYVLTNHVAKLNVPAESINKFKPHVYGHMFVVTVNKQRVYCGFIFPSNSSAVPQWVMISEPMEAEKKENKLAIHFIHQQQNLDPRSDNRIINRLRADGKLAK